MRQLGMVFFLALSSVGYGRAAAITEFYVDPEFMGATRDGHAATPWNSLGGGSSAAWNAINSALNAGDVTIYFSARQAGIDANQPANWALDLYRRSSSAYRLTLDG